MKNESKKPFLTKKDILEFLALTVFILLLRTFIFVPVQVDGSSMMPTLTDKQRLWSSKISEVSRFDIINFNPPVEADNSYIKRVIGLPGDHVAYRNDQLYINGQPMAEPFLDEFKQSLDEGVFLTEDYSLETSLGIDKIPAGHYYVRGDNRRNSYDSKDFGLIDAEAIIGIAKFSYWPFSQFGTLKIE